MAISLNNLATSEAYQYKKQEYDFKCDEPTRDTDSKFCIFHDINYLKDDNYKKNKEEVVDEFKKKLSNHPKGTPFKFIGYCLPDISFQSKRFTEALYFNDATFYGVADFSGATFSEYTTFSDTTFYNEAVFKRATFLGRLFAGAVFLDKSYFNLAKFSSETYFNTAKFSKEAIFSGAEFSGAFVSFAGAKFSGEAMFFDAKIKGAIFSGAEFSGEADFINTIFVDRESFSFANFSDCATFCSAKFSGEAVFHQANFSNEANFISSKFSDVAHFSGNFNGETYFNYVIFEQPDKIIFEVKDMSKVSFLNTDIVKVRFSDKIVWGGKDKFKVIEEEWIEKALKKEKVEKKDIEEQIEIEEISLGGVLSVYRHLRENYEFRLQYDEGGKFFIKEMEVKRKYRQVPSSFSTSGFEIKKNCWFKRNIFSLTGWYHNISRYGEDLLRPILIGILIIFLSTFFLVTQSNPDLNPAFPTIFPAKSDKVNLTKNTISTISNGPKKTTNVNMTNSIFVGLDKAGNPSQWSKAFQRSVADFDPILSPGSDIKVGIIDYVVKIVGGGLTFGLLLIALRRKFERKYTR